jgi:putative selenium metabolism hydrolase
MDFEKIRELAKKYEPDMTRFLRDMVAIPSESTQEERLILRIKEEMERVGFDKVEIDPMGNILGTIGHGSHLIALDAHIDTVGVGDRSLWNFDPYEGIEDETTIGGRGSSDQEGGMASMVTAGRIIKDLGLEGDYTLVMVGSVQEEDCDGLPWQYIVNEDKLRPEFVVSTEPTQGDIHRGQRGRMEIRVRTSGTSCHGSAPERGDNAIYKMAPILIELRALHENLKGPLPRQGEASRVRRSSTAPPPAVPWRVGCWSPSGVALAPRGEGGEYAPADRQSAPVKAAGAEVSLYSYERPPTRGWLTPRRCYFPSWVWRRTIR